MKRYFLILIILCSCFEIEKPKESFNCITYDNCFVKFNVYKFYQDKHIPDAEPEYILLKSELNFNEKISMICFFDQLRYVDYFFKGDVLYINQNDVSGRVEQTMYTWYSQAMKSICFDEACM